MGLEKSVLKELREKRKLYIGIPKGALNSPDSNKGWTKLLLKHAGWELEGYEPGKEEPYPTIVKGDREVKFICMRPRLIAQFLDNHALDMGLIGEDIVREHIAKKLYPWYSENINRISNIRGLQYRLGGSGRPKLHIIDSSCDEYGFMWSVFKKAISQGYYCLGILDSNKPEIHQGMFEQNWPGLTTEFKIKNWAVQDVHNSLVALIRKNQGIMKVSDLGYGHVNLCFAMRESMAPGKGQLHTLSYPLATEYPYLAYFEVCEDTAPEGVIIDGSSTDIGAFTKLIKEIKGCETATLTFGAHSILECVSSGVHLKKYGLVRVGNPLMSSTGGIYKPRKSSKDRPAYIEEIRHSEFDTAGFSNEFKEQINQEAKTNKSWINSKIKEVSERLKAASLEYGKTRRDSVYYKGEKD